MPVLAPRQQAFVSRAVRETSLNSMAGVAHDEWVGEQEEVDGTGLNQPDNAVAEDTVAEDKAAKAARKKKRKLYKHISGTDVPWFPHDNAIDLLKELCWEAGRPRWVFHGTPAGGAGVHGCLEAGCSVVALCYDEHHRTHLTTFLSERFVESTVNGTTMVFKDDALQARSVQLDLTPTPKAASAKKPEEKDSAGEHDIEPKSKKDKKRETEKDKKETKEATDKKSKAKATPNKVTATGESSSSDSDSDGDSDSDSEGAKSRAAKKHTNTRRGSSAWLRASASLRVSSMHQPAGKDTQ